MRNLLGIFFQKLKEKCECYTNIKAIHVEYLEWLILKIQFFDEKYVIVMT